MSLNLLPTARLVEMLTNEIFSSNEEKIRIYGILKMGVQSGEAPLVGAG